VDCQHAKVRALLNEHLTKNGMPAFPRDFVIHSLRHTMLSRLGEAGADAFTVMRIAGHSTVVVSQRYVHPSPESLERAFERLEAANQKAVAKLPQREKVLPLPTNLPTLPAAGGAAVS
jgi:integrase